MYLKRSTKTLKMQLSIVGDKLCEAILPEAVGDINFDACSAKLHRILDVFLERIEASLAVLREEVPVP